MDTIEKDITARPDAVLRDGRALANLIVPDTGLMSKAPDLLQML